jgi:aminoglycoside phosphotransferase family enzyme
VMRRMPEDRRLSSLVVAGKGVDDGLREVARRVAALHLRCGRAPASDAAASSAAALARWESNHDEMAPLAALLTDPRTAERALALARRYAAGRDALFAERIAAGRAVDGHGDLLADDIFLLADGPRILDAIEFDPVLRAGDGLADIAFLAMDLERLGSPADAARLLGWYAEFTGDRWPARWPTSTSPTGLRSGPRWRACAPRKWAATKPPKPTPSWALPSATWRPAV